MLDPPLLEDSTLPVFVRVAKLSLGTIGHHLNIVMGMERPNCPWR
jgi:hypothetical protein